MGAHEAKTHEAKTQATHWADIYADKIIREKGEKELYVCASGITPSGTIHIGNFREIISVDLVARALKRKGKNVRFIYSWDDYDVFRKVPANMPEQERLKTYLRKPITLTPDPTGTEKSYARKNEREVEELLPIVGVHPDYIYQADKYRNSAYAEEIRKALEHRETIRNTLNEHRTSPLPADWWPISIFCLACDRDTTKIEDWDGQWKLTYTCDSCGHNETVDIRSSPGVKLLWRIDWPMRWAYQRVDFEPAGKEHHSAGGSFDTARKIVKQVYNFEAPTTFKYDFIGIKGRGGKISSSAGEVVGLGEVLKIYQPEVVRYMFTSTRPNSEFSISFDLDVIKLYEDYDRCERIYYDREKVSEKRKDRERRIYELSQIESVLSHMPTQIPFRHLCNLLQSNDGSIDRVLQYLKIDSRDEDLDRIRRRAGCALNWINAYAPEDFRFSLRPSDSAPLKVTVLEEKALALFRDELEKNLDNHNEKSISLIIYSTAKEAGIDPKDFFKLVYRVLINKEKGPRLAGFLLTINKERILKLLKLISL